MVPLHLLAFLLLYFLSTRLLVTEITSATSDQARARLDHESREIFSIALDGPADSTGAHRFDEMMNTHGEVDLRMFLPGGRMVGSSDLPMVEHKEMIDFLASNERERIWMSREANARLMRGLERVVATADCTPCHQAGQVLAITSMTIDLTEPIERVLSRGRRGMFFIIVVWATVLTLTTVIVRRSVQRSASRFEAQLDAAHTAGSAPPDAPPDLVLDPTTARLQEALRNFLHRQRARQREVANRLAHSDRLASLGQLAAGLAHEIKNPLAGIQGALEILQEDEDKGSTKLLYGEMLSELGRVNETLQSLLASARPTPPKIARGDARQLVEEVQRLLTPSLRRKKISLDAEFAEGEIIAPFDATKVRQVLINLIQNAADAIGEDGSIVVSVAPCPDGTGVIFVVEDNGPGIAEEHQANVLEPFYTTKFTGTGLGLAITRGLVEQHGGTLQFESTPGEGTTFYVILPEIRDDTVQSDGKSAETDT